MRRRIEATVAVVAAVLVFAAAGYVIFHKDPVKNAGQTPAFSVAPTRSGDTSPTGSSASSQSKPVVAFLGDSYTSGEGATDKSKDFVNLLATDLGIDPRIESVDGGGYAKSSSSGDTYADHVEAIVQADPQVVVVTGGRNDTADDVNTLKNDAKKLFADLHDKLPKAKLVAVAPFWGDSDQPPELQPVADAVQSAVQAVGGKYLDISDPLHGHSNYMANQSNPNDKGYQAIADALEPGLKAVLPKS